MVDQSSVEFVGVQHILYPEDFVLSFAVSYIATDQRKVIKDNVASLDEDHGVMKVTSLRNKNTQKMSRCNHQQDLL